VTPQDGPLSPKIAVRDDGTGDRRPRSAGSAVVAKIARALAGARDRTLEDKAATRIRVAWDSMVGDSRIGPGSGKARQPCFRPPHGASSGKEETHDRPTDSGSLSDTAGSRSPWRRGFKQ